MASAPPTGPDSAPREHRPSFDRIELLGRLREVNDPIALLAGIFAHSPTALQIYRADGHCLVVNAAFRKLFGSEPPPEYNVLNDEIAQANGVLDLIRRAFRGETVVVPPIWYDPRELRQVKVTEGNRVAIESTFFPLRSRDGTIEHVAIVFKDLTAERTLREQAEGERDLLGLIIHQSGDGIIVADASGTLRVFNQQAELQHGVPFAPIGPTRWSDVYGLRALDGRKLTLEETPLYRALQGEVVERAQWLVERPDGTRRILSGTATPLRRDGTQAGAMLITRDETARLEDERRLRFHATVLRNIRDSVIVTDLGARIVDWNEGATQVFGYLREDALGRSVGMLYPDMDSDQLARDLQSIMEGKDHVGTWQGRRADGSPVWVDVVTTLMRDEYGRPIGFVGIGKDATDRIRVEEERARAHEERERALALAESASRAKDEFLAMLGHELRNPLSPIVTALELMKLQGNTAAAKELRVIQRQVEHLVRLVDDLLDVSRITRGKVELAKRPIDLATAVHNAIEMAGPLLEQRRQRFELSIPPHPLLLNADVGRLAQVIANLLTNAAKYTAPGGSISLRAYEEGDDIVLAVRDDGVGIDPELLPQVFDLFVQGPRSIARAEGGLGIGLTLVKNLVQLHGGTVEARSRGVGAGSEFVVRLPALRDPTKKTSARESSPPRRGRFSAAVPRRIAIVDDNVDAAELLAAMLSRAGHEVRVAYDGPQMLRLVESFVPEIALIDIGLPVMDGYELAARVHDTLGPRAPHFIAVTGYGQAHDHARSREAGFADHLVKPVDAERLLERIDRFAVEG